MIITIYSKHNCPNCDSAKQLLKSKGLEYEEYNVQDNPERLTFLLQNYPEARQMPQVFIFSQRVGGLEGLKQALQQLKV